MYRFRLLYLLTVLAAAFLYVLNGSYELLFPVLILTVLALTGAVLVLIGGRKLELIFELPEGVEKNSGSNGRIRIQNHSWVPVLRGEIELVWKNTLTDEMGRSVLPFAVLPKAETELEIAIQVKYSGAHNINIKEICIYDIFRIFSAGRRCEASEELLVYPKTEQVQLPVIQKDAYDMESFRYSQVKRGDDTNETFDIREYRMGDSIRKIHWKLTGKMDSIMIRESSYPIVNSILLLLETGYGETQKSSPKKMDAAVSVFLSLGEMLLEQKTPFGIGFYDYDKHVFCTERIESAEALWNMVPDLLRAGREVSLYSAYDQYQMNFDDRQYAHYIYVTAETGDENSGVNESGLYGASSKVTILRCTDDCRQEENEIHFTAEKWKEELA